MKKSATRYFLGLILVSLMFVAAPVIAQDESAKLKPKPEPIQTNSSHTVPTASTKKRSDIMPPARM